MEPNMMTQGVPAEGWAKLAELANTTPDEFKARYEALLAGGPQLQPVAVKLADSLQSNGDCIERSFEVSLFKVVGVSGKVTICGSGTSDWSATVHICLDVAGSSVWCTDYTLSPQNISVCFNPDLFAVKGRLCIGIVGPNLCFNINGNICYWAFGWQCADFNQTLFCFK